MSSKVKSGFDMNLKIEDIIGDVDENDWRCGREDIIGDEDESSAAAGKSRHTNLAESSRYACIYKGIVDAEEKLAIVRTTLVELCNEHSIDSPLKPFTRLHPAQAVPQKLSPGIQEATSTHTPCIEEATSIIDLRTREVICDEILTKCRLSDQSAAEAFSDEKPIASEYVVLYGNHPDKECRVEPRTAKKTSQYANIQASANFLMVDACAGFVRLPIAFPHARLRMAWVMLCLPLICYETFSIPYFIAFEGETTEVVAFLDLVIFIYYSLDIVCSSLTGYFDHDGKLVMIPSRILLRYLRTWFLIDFVSAIPWNYVSRSASAARFSKIFRAMHTLKVIHLVRWVSTTHTKSFNETVHWFIEQNQLSMFISSFTKVFFVLFAITHWAACIWYLIGTNGKSSWVDKYLRGHDASTDEHYISALYFTLATMTTVGYGDITPQTFPEVCFVLILLLAAGLVFASLLGQVSDLVSNWNSASHAKAERKHVLARYVKWRAVPQDLTRDIREHMAFVWETGGYWDTYEEGLMKQLPPYLRSELCFHLYGRVLLSTPCFAWMTDYTACIKKLASHVSANFFDKNDDMFKRGQSCTKVHVLLDGAVWLTQNEVAVGHEDHFSACCLGSSSFMIPRNKQAGLVDVGRTVALGLQESLAHKNTNSQKHIVHALSAFKIKFDPVALGTDTSPTNGFVESRDGIVKVASLKMKVRDHQLHAAAIRVQRAWRRRKGNDMRKRQNYQRGATIDFSSAAVHAPAYFGESCLWVPFQNWSLGDVDQYIYSARCTVRSEAVIITRESVQTVILEFSPFLEERLKAFQEFVQEAWREDVLSS